MGRNGLSIGNLAGMMPVVSSLQITRRQFLTVAMGASVLGAQPHAESPASHAFPIRIANASGALNQTLAALMRQQRFLESFGLAPEVLQVADGTRILAAIVSGSVDLSLMSGFGQVFPAIERGAAIRILAAGALRPTLALFSSKPSIRTLKDLVGGTIGTGSIGALLYQLTVTLLRKYEVDTSRIRFVNVGSSADILRAVAAGVVDAGAGEASLIGISEQYHVHPIEHGDMSNELSGYPFQAAWAAERSIANHRDLLVRALAAAARLYRFVQSAAAREAFMTARRSVFPRESEREADVAWSYIQTARPYAVDLLLTPERLRYVQELNVRFGVQRAVLPFDRIADMSLAADALRLL